MTQLGKVDSPIDLLKSLTDFSGLLNVELVSAPGKVRMSERHEGRERLLDLVSRVEEDLDPSIIDNKHVISWRCVSGHHACTLSSLLVY